MIGMLGLWIVIAIAAAIAAAGVFGVVIGVAITLTAMAVLAGVAAVHLITAWLVWRSRPRTRVLFRRQTWAMLTVALGPIWAGVFWFLHWGRRVTPCCNVCGYARTERDAWLKCPECSTEYPARVPKADIRVGRA